MRSIQIYKNYTFIVLVAIVFLLSGQKVRASEIEISDMNLQNTLIYSYPVNEENVPSFLPANEHEPMGPDAFFLAENKLFIDDTINCRILVYEKGVYNKSILLPWNQNAKLLYYDAVADELKIVYEDREDSSCTHLYLVSYNVTSGEMVSEAQELSDADNILLEYCFDSSGNLLTHYYTEKTVFEETELITSPVNTMILASTLNLDNEKLGELSTDMVVAANGRNQYSHCSKYTVSDSSIKVAECIVVCKDSVPISFVEPEQYEDEFKRGYVQATSTGQIYQMAVSEDGLHIYRLQEIPINTMGTYNFSSRAVAQIQNVEVMSTAASYQAISAYVVRDRLNEYRNLAWTFNSTKNSNKSVTGDSSKVTQPSWLSNLSKGVNHSVVSVPYCWGGWNAESFVQKINSGSFAGNVSTPSTGYVSGTVGMDCSGYVSVAFNLPSKHGTSTLSQCFTALTDSSSVMPFDIINKAGSHVRIISRIYTSGGVRYVDYWEENITDGKAVYKSGQNYQSILNAGYVPMRYNYLTP